MLYIVQRDDIDNFKIASDIDPVYAKNLLMAMKSGVEVFCYDCKFSKKDISINSEKKFLNE